MRILLTGASGFVGRALARALAGAGHEVTPVLRSAAVAPQPGARAPVFADLAGDVAWPAIVQGHDTVVHVAARVHVMADTAADPLQAFRVLNTAATLRLARAAADAGVRRFVFVSTIKVLGEQTAAGRPFKADDPARPQDAYAVSKHEAELGLQELGRRTGMEIVVVRPPLVYGPGVRGNFASLVRWLDRGVPLPLGLCTHNRRSLVALDNLVDLLLQCVSQAAAANRVLLVSDGEDLSTADLLRRLAAARGQRARLLPVPVWLLAGLARMVGRGAAMQRLSGSLQVDISETRQLLQWTPPIDVDEGLRRTGGPVL